MSIIRFKYINVLDAGTVFRWSSQLGSLPATNVQNDILAKIWKTDSNFIVTAYNNNLPFRNTATGSVKNYAIPSATYTGSGLATKMQSALNSLGDYGGHTVVYDGEKFTFDSNRASTGLFSLLWGDPTYSATTIAILTGFAHGSDKTGAYAYTSTVSTLGNEHEIIIQLSATSTVTTFIVDKHNFTSGAVVRLRGTKETATVFNGGWNQTADITLSSTLTANSTIIVTEFVATSLKSIQLYWHDRDLAYSEIGRLWAGTYFEPNYQRSNTITWKELTHEYRSKAFVSDGGASFFDKRDDLKLYEILTEPMEEYFDSETKTGYENMIDEIKNDKCIYITLDSGDLHDSTIYGYQANKIITYGREGMTPIIALNNLLFREQK
jgi:hypothetical protein